MPDEESQYQPLERLDQMLELAEDLEELKQNQSFQRVFLNNYLGNRFEELQGRILRNAETATEEPDIVREYQALAHFRNYMELIEEGKKARFYKEMHRKAIEDGWNEQDLDLIRRSQNV